MSSTNAYDITLLDLSPMLTYQPQRDIDFPEAGWKLSYDGSPDTSYDITHKTDNEGQGTSTHSTRMNGASVSVDFYGTGVTVYGAGVEGTYVTTIDSEETGGAPEATKLFAVDSLPLDKHTLV